MDIGNLCRCHNAVHITLAVGDGDVFAYCLAEQKRLLHNKGNVFAQPDKVYVVDVYSVNGNCAAVRGVKTAQQCHNGAFAAARRPENCHRLSFFDGEGQMVKDNLTVKGKTYIVKSYVVFKFKVRAAVVVFNRGFADFGNTAERNGCLAHIAHNSAKGTDWPGKHAVEGHKGHNLARGDVAVNGKNGACAQHQNNLEAGEYIAPCPEHCQQVADLYPKAGELLIVTLELVQLVLLLAEGTDHTGCRKIFLCHCLQLALCLVRNGEIVLNTLVEQHRKQTDCRHADKGDKGQSHRNIKHKPVCHCDFCNYTDNLCHFHHKVAHHIDIGGTALDNVTCLHIFVVGKAGPLQMLKHRLAHIVAKVFPQIVAGKQAALFAQDGGYCHHRKDCNEHIQMLYKKIPAAPFFQ